MTLVALRSEAGGGAQPRGGDRLSCGPAAGLAEIDAIESLGRLDDYLFLAATRADLLRRDGRPQEALPHYRRARELARNDPERRFFDCRLAECGAEDRAR